MEGPGQEKLPFFDSSTPELTNRSSLWLFLVAPLAWLRLLVVATILWTYSLFVVAMTYGYEATSDAFLPKMRNYPLVKRGGELMCGCEEGRLQHTI